MSNPSQQNQNQQPRPPATGANVSGSRVPPRQNLTLPRQKQQIQQQRQQGQTAASRSHAAQQQPQQFHQQTRQKPQSNNVVNNASSSEAIAQKVQGAINVIRSEREREFRGRNMAQERLRVSKASLKALQLQVQEEIFKDEQMTKEMTKMKVQVQEKELSNVGTKSKYEFNHQELIRKRQKVAEFKLVIKQDEEKQKNTFDKSRLLQEQQKNIVKAIEAKDSKAAVFRDLLVRSRRRMDKKTAKSAETTEYFHNKEDKRLARDLRDLHAQSCLLMLPGMIKVKALTIEKQTEITRIYIARLKAMAETAMSTTGDVGFKSFEKKSQDATGH